MVDEFLLKLVLKEGLYDSIKVFGVASTQVKV